ncbi:hypothetical protein D187_000424 [Cystobacter fuscus DSM 2262]|uniref:Lipoprotein n=1 Tax=Cystobacter fuscus (strain ATCC 25194 / DSM 2262 / NBRC 100088 / M29) TaxID=1242864 RepID=S9QUK0_CYSF2|nr:hypothetical protein [Cystobacter fuscus]EPX64999.1 hypothetical protein D187_000424 [Cystobacter fuscus DSM 2262]
MQRSRVLVVVLGGGVLAGLWGLAGCGIKGPARPPLPPSAPPTTETQAPAEAGRGPFAPSAPPPEDAGTP